MAIDPKWPVKFTREKWTTFTEDLEGGAVVNLMFMVRDKQVATGFGITWTGRTLAAAGKFEAKRLTWNYKKGHAREFTRCDPDDIDKDYDAVLDAPARLSDTNGHLAEWADLTQCRNTKDSLMNELFRRVAINANVIRHGIINNFDQMPADAQMCVISMTWAHGPNWGAVNDKKVKEQLFSFARACEKLDFDEAAKFSGYGAKDLTLPVRGRDELEMLNNAHNVVHGHGSYDVCYWPGRPPITPAIGISDAIDGPPALGPRPIGSRGMY